MKTQALNIQIGDRIVAYCNNKRQACTVKEVLDSGQGSIALTQYPPRIIGVRSLGCFGFTGML